MNTLELLLEIKYHQKRLVVLREEAIKHLASLSGEEKLLFYKEVPDRYLKHYSWIEHIEDPETKVDLLEQNEYNRGHEVTKSELLDQLGVFDEEYVPWRSWTYSISSKDETGRTIYEKKPVTQEMVDGWIECMMQKSVGTIVIDW